MNYGSSITFTITPNTGYHTTDVRVDGVSQGAISSYTFSNVTANHTISATFAIRNFEIKASAGSGGSVSPTDVWVPYKTSQTVSITPSSGYKIADMQVDGTSVGAVSSYTFNNIAANHTVSATFTANTTTASTTASFNITASAGTGGGISPAGTATVSTGGSQTYTITPAGGYKIGGVTVDGAAVGVVSSYTFSNVTANHTISATFAKKSGK